MKNTHKTLDYQTRGLFNFIDITDEVKAWDAAQNALTDTILNEWPDDKKLRGTIHRTLLEGASKVRGTPTFYGAYTFQPGSKPDGPKTVLWVTQETTGASRILVDPNTMAEGARLDWFFPSPNGEYVAYGISLHGDEQL